MLHRNKKIYFLFITITICKLIYANDIFAHVDTIEPKAVSLVQLIATPSKFDGKLIRVIGYCQLEFEGNALYLHREDFEYGITKNAVWLEVESMRCEPKQGYVIVEGVFDCQNKGHMDLFSGKLKRVIRLEHWQSRKELKSSTTMD